MQNTVTVRLSRKQKTISLIIVVDKAKQVSIAVSCAKYGHREPAMEAEDSVSYVTVLDKATQVSTACSRAKYSHCEVLVPSIVTARFLCKM